MKRETLRWILIFFSLFLAEMAMAVAESKVKNSFDHFSTGFPLTGAHMSVSCDSCHIKGIFKGTPTKCSGCHKGVIAQGKPPNHIPTSESCENCHYITSTDWTIAGGFNHIGVQGNCVSCHNGSLATGKNSEHIRSTKICEACHTSTRLWTPVISVDHNEIQGTCSTCHNNRISVGKGPGHISTNQECDVCHKSTISWIPANFDHSDISANCIRCHSGEKPTNHIPTTGDCSSCHRVNPLEWANAIFDHSTISGQRCDSCHSGTFIGATGKSANHIPVPPGTDCGSCHTTIDWSGANLDHNQIKAPCGSCHASSKPSNHFPTTADCRQCHQVNPLVWDNATFDHATTASACISCHTGGFAGAEGKSANHISTNDRCEACHLSTDWVIVNIDHSQINNVATCTTCHAKDKSITHFPTAPAQECGVCHSSTQPLDWTNAKFDHATIGNARCDSCHNGSFDGTGALGKGNSHIPVSPGADCRACHEVPPATFAALTLFNHAQVSSLRCDACHNGSFTSAGALGKNSTHPSVPAGADCKSCHSSTTDFAANVAFDHSIITSTCASCHNKDKSTNHIPVPAGVDCASCHTIPPATFVSATKFNHSQVSTIACTQCHNGSFAGAGALGTPPGHFSTTVDCKNCHNTISFLQVSFTHSSPNYPGDHNPSVTCLSCHTGNSQVVSWRSAALKPFCAGCHQNDFDAGEHQKVQTPSINYTAAELKDCAGACHIYTDSSLTTIAQRRSGEHRPNDGGF